MKTNQKYLKIYSDFLREKADIKRPLKVVLDFSNGVAVIPAEKVFEKLPNVEAFFINDKIDGDFPAHGPNPILDGATDQLSEAVIKEKADLGVVFDADGDRAMFVDEKGKLIEGNYIAITLFKNEKPPFVVNEISYKCLERLGLEKMSDIVPTLVGHRFMKDKMRELSANVGAEYSGHYYFKDFYYMDGGIMAVIKILNSLSRLQTTIGEYVTTMPKFVLRNIDLKTKLSWPEAETLLKAGFEKEKAPMAFRDGVSADFNEGFINVRFSRNESLLRIYAGAKDVATTKTLIEKARRLVEK